MVVCLEGVISAGGCGYGRGGLSDAELQALLPEDDVLSCYKRFIIVKFD